MTKKWLHGDQMSVFVTGGYGGLGKEVVKQFPGSIAPPKKELDIRNTSMVYDFIRKNEPQIIIHLAALTGVTQCENNKELAWETNVKGTQNLVKACLEHSENNYFVYCSTTNWYIAFGS